MRRIRAGQGTSPRTARPCGPGTSAACRPSLWIRSGAVTLQPEWGTPAIEGGDTVPHPLSLGRTRSATEYFLNPWREPRLWMKAGFRRARGRGWGWLQGYRKTGGMAGELVERGRPVSVVEWARKGSATIAMMVRRREAELFSVAVRRSRRRGGQAPPPRDCTARSAPSARGRGG